MRATLMIVVFALLASACGMDIFEASPLPPGLPTLYAPNVPSSSGHIYGPPAAPSVVSSAGTMVLVGDRANDYAEYGYYRFDISALPVASDIESAEFSVGQESHQGTPFADLGGQVVIDHVALGAALDPADYAPTVYAADIAVLTTGTAIGRRTVDITGAVEADVSAGRTYTDIRLRFPIESDGLADWDDVMFNNEDDTGGSGLRPTLLIHYRAP